jgi:hypothetical protein
MAKISDSCLLVNLKISVFSGTKTDKKLTGEISETHRTKNDALRVVKRLVSKEDPDLQLVNKIVSEIRTFHRENTVPWGDDGARMLPGRHHDTYMKSLRNLIEKGESAASAFVARWPEKLAQAKIDLNGTFNAADYPDESTIASHFSFRIIRAPVPDGGDIRVDLPAQEIEAMRREISERIEEAEKAATNELYARLGEPLANLVNKLGEKDSDGKPAVFRNTLVSNVLEIANLIPALNVTGDSKLDQLRKEILDTLGKVRPDELRDDVFTRKETLEKAQNILDMMLPAQEAA